MNRLPIFIILFLFITQATSAQRYNNYGGYNCRGGDGEQRFRLSVDGGWSYRLAKVSDAVPPDFRDYIKDLKSGYGYGANATFFITSSMGLGVEYSGFRSKKSINDVWARDTATKKIVTGSLKDDITIQFIGPSFIARTVMGRNSNFHFLVNIAIGYVSYKDKGVLVDKNFTMTGGTVGTSIGFGLDIMLTQNVFFGTKVGLTGGSLSGYNFDDGTTKEWIDLPEDAPEGLGRVDVSGGLRFNF